MDEKSRALLSLHAGHAAATILERLAASCLGPADERQLREELHSRILYQMTRLALALEEAHERAGAADS
jgi:hypothetical protein